jgi:hypothetical protein
MPAILTPRKGLDRLRHLSRHTFVSGSARCARSHCNPAMSFVFSFIWAGGYYNRSLCHRRQMTYNQAGIL